VSSVLVENPPLCNTGGKTVNSDSPEALVYPPELSHHLFTDWFRVVLLKPIWRTIEPLPSKYDSTKSGSSGLNNLLNQLQCYMPHSNRIESGKGNYMYKHKLALINRVNEVSCSVHFGGNSDTILCESSGHHSEHFRELIKDMYTLRCTRRDIAFDYISEISIHEIHSEVERLTDQRWYITDKGRGVTLENCSKRNGREYFIRIYEKGKQLGLDCNWVRIETEIKIESSNKVRREWLSTCSNESAIQGNKQSVDVYNYFAGLNLSRVMSPRTEADRRTTSLSNLLPHVNKQYRKFFIDLLAHFNGDSNSMFHALVKGEMPDKPVYPDFNKKLLADFNRAKSARDYSALKWTNEHAH